MAMSVVVSRNSDGTPETTEQFDKGQAILVGKDGHLFIYTNWRRDDDMIIAVFTPDAWLSVVLNES